MLCLRNFTRVYIQVAMYVVIFLKIKYLILNVKYLDNKI